MKMTSKGNNKMAWIRKDIKDQLAPSPLPWAESCSTRPVTQRPAQASIEHFQGWGTYKFSRKKMHKIDHILAYFLCKFFSIVFSLKRLANGSPENLGHFVYFMDTKKECVQREVTENKH